MGSINILLFVSMCVCGGNGDDVPTPLEIEILRILIQEERESPKYLYVETISERLEADYGSDTVEQVIDSLAGRPGSAVGYLSPNEDCVTVRDIEEAGDRLCKLMDDQRDHFFG